MGVDPGTLHGNRDAVEENDHQDDMVEHLVSDDLVASHTEPVGIPLLSSFGISKGFLNPHPGTSKHCCGTQFT